MCKRGFQVKLILLYLTMRVFEAEEKIDYK